MYSKRILLGITLSLAVVGCQNMHRHSKPKHLIKEDKMVDILVDLAKVNAALSLNSREYGKREVSGRDLIFEKYDIDSAQWVHNSAYYADRFKKNEKIYERVRERLENEKDELDSLEKAKKEKEEAKDSVKE